MLIEKRIWVFTLIVLQEEEESFLKIERVDKVHSFIPGKLYIYIHTCQICWYYIMKMSTKND